MKYTITFNRQTLDGISLGSSTVIRNYGTTQGLRQGIGLLKHVYRDKGEVLTDIKYCPASDIHIDSVERIEDIPVYDGRPILDGKMYMGNHMQCSTCGVVVDKHGCTSC